MSDEPDFDYFDRMEMQVVLSAHFLKRWVTRGYSSERRFPFQTFARLLPRIAEIAFREEPMRCMSPVGGGFNIAYRYDRRLKSLVIITLLPQRDREHDAMTKYVPIEQGTL